MSIPKCENPECDKPAARNAKNTAYLRHCSTRCKCACNSNKGSEKRKKTNLERYGVTCNLKHSDTQEKIKQTKLEKYGVEHHMKTNDSKEKLKATKKERYGDESFNNRVKFKQTMELFTQEEKRAIDENRKSTVLKKYGKEFITQTDEFKQKTKQTNLERYGHENAAQSDIVKQKIIHTMNERYGAHYTQQHISPDSLEKLSRPEFLKANSHRSLADLGNELGVSYYTVDYAYKKFEIERTFDQYQRSLAESKIREFIESLGFECKQGVRNIIFPQEIDLVIPEANLGIEYDGLYWHCETSGKNKNYHIEKTRSCKEKNIRLIHILDYEWKNKQEIVKSRLMNLLGKSKKIGARQCSVVELSPTEAAEFLEKTHIQGATGSSVRYGLMYHGKIVSVMTFGKSRYNQNYQYELLRFSNDLGVVVIGGASRLFSHFVKLHLPDTVVSYCDRRWNTGTVYQKIGFEFKENTNPNYWYTKQYLTLESRIKYQKHKLSKLLENFDPGLTEWENMVNQGFDRYWDCGNGVWVWRK